MKTALHTAGILYAGSPAAGEAGAETDEEITLEDRSEASLDAVNNSYLNDMNNKTFTIIKPDAVAAGKTGKILDMIIGGGFTLRAMRMTRMSRDDAGKFYEIHREKPFFGELTDFMTSGPIVVAVLEKDGAVLSLRELAGHTDPAKAAEGTIRRLFGTNIGCNAIHASDSDENARIEMGQFFCENEY